MKANRLVIFTGLLLMLSLPAPEQTGAGAVHGFVDGLLHPLLGVDHLLVMLAIGLWAAMRGGRALWLLPMTFLTAMGAGRVYLCSVSPSQRRKAGWPFRYWLQDCLCGETIVFPLVLRQLWQPDLH